MFRVVRAVAALCLFTVFSSLLGGCTTAADAGNSFGDSQLVNEIANRLSKASGESYTATYALAGVGKATLAHNIDTFTTSLRYPTGMVLLTASTTTSCQVTGKSPACSTTSSDVPQPVIDKTVETGGMIRPEAVIAKLSQTALNADAILAESDRTVAGTDETCVSITGVPVESRFTACVTSEGLLGAFTGSINGLPINVQLVDFTMTVDEASFATP